jgi:hypothetical protein
MVISADNIEDSMETMLLETGQYTAQTLDAAASYGSQGHVEGASRRAPVMQQQLEGAASLLSKRWCLLVALIGDAAGEEHGGSRGRHRVKCNKEKAKVKFCLTMEAA